MKYGTGLLIAVAAVVGCSYVGSVGAVTCEQIGVKLAEVSASARSIPVSRNDAPKAYDALADSFTASCKIGADLRKQGYSQTDAATVVRGAVADAEVGSAELLDSMTLSNAAFSLGFNQAE